jgi:hypothetical protein
MFYVVECLRPTIYDWCTSLLAKMKSHLMDFKQGRMINFVFSFILHIFFFERVLGLNLRIEITPHRLCDPTMPRWTNVKRRLGGGRLSTPYNDDLFFWWC